MAAPATCPVALRARIRRCRFAHPLPIMVVIVARETVMETELSAGSERRCIGLDVHREFAQVAVWQGGLVIQAGRFATTPEGVRAFADGLGPADEVALEATGALRRQVLRRAHIVRQRTRLKNQVHAILHRNLIPRCPAADLFGHKGRAWLAQQELPADELVAATAL